MNRETNTVALVASTLGMATVVAITAVISATASRAEADQPKILDRIADAQPSIGMSVEKPATPRFVQIADASGTTVYRADPAARETVISKDVPQIGDRVPVPMARNEAVLGLTVALATPLPRPDEAFNVGAVRLPQPRPVVAVQMAEVKTPLPKPVTTADAALKQYEPQSEGLVHLTAYSGETVQ